MAYFSMIFAPVGGGNTNASDRTDISATLATVTSSAAIVLGAYQAFNFSANTAMTIRFGNTGIPAAAAGDFQIPANTLVTFAVTKTNPVIRIFNPTGGNGTYWIQPLALAV